MPRKGKSLYDWCLENADRGKIVWEGALLANDKNLEDGIDIYNISKSSHVKVNFICDKGHKFCMRLDSVTNNGSWCKECMKYVGSETRIKNQLRDNKKETLYNWCMNNYTKDGRKVYEGYLRAEQINLSHNINIYNITSHSKRKMTFICECGHKFESSISSITTQKSWCKKCYDNNRSLILKEKSNITRIKKGSAISFRQWCLNNGNIGLEILEAFNRCKELNDKLDINIDLVTIKSNQKVYFQCNKFHDIQFKSISDVTRNMSFCSTCRYFKTKKSLQEYNANMEGKTSLYEYFMYDDFGKILYEDYKRAGMKNNNIDLFKLTFRSNELLWWKCKNDTHPIYQMSTNDRVRGRGCKYCSKKTSFPEQIIYLWCQSNFDEVYNMDRSLGKEADILIKDINFIIEYNGEFYHKDKHEKDDDKRIYFESLGYKVLQIYEKTHKEKTEIFSDSVIIHNHSRDRKCIKLIEILNLYFENKNIYIKNKNLSNEIIYKARSIMQS